MVILDSKTFPGVSVDILEHLGMRVRDIEGHGVITGRAIAAEAEIECWCAGHIINWSAATPQPRLSCIHIHNTGDYGVSTVQYSHFSSQTASLVTFSQ